MNKKILVTVLSISLFHFSVNAMGKSVSGFFDSAKNFFLPYEVIDHTYRLAADGKIRERYHLADQSDTNVVKDDIGTAFKSHSYSRGLVDGYSPVPQPNGGVWFVMKSAANKINEKKDEYADQTTALNSDPHVSLKGPRVWYRNHVGRHTLSFILNYPRMATSLKYGALMSGLYGGYSWFKSKSKKLVESDTEFEGDVSN